MINGCYQEYWILDKRVKKERCTRQRYGENKTLRLMVLRGVTRSLPLGCASSFLVASGNLEYCPSPFKSLSYPTSVAPACREHSHLSLLTQHNNNNNTTSQSVSRATEEEEEGVNMQQSPTQMGAQQRNAIIIYINVRGLCVSHQ